ncbi:unnamed protein product, partial [Ectocarpus sp. 12 AP-2014]
LPLLWRCYCCWAAPALSSAPLSDVVDMKNRLSSTFSFVRISQAKEARLYGHRLTKRLAQSIDDLRVPPLASCGGTALSSPFLFRHLSHSSGLAWPTLYSR